MRGVGLESVAILPPPRKPDRMRLCERTYLRARLCVERRHGDEDLERSWPTRPPPVRKECVDDRDSWYNTPASFSRSHPFTKRECSGSRPLIDAQSNESPDEGPLPFFPEEREGNRLDKAVKLHFGLPWSKARAWIETGKVFLDGNPVTALDHVVNAGQRIELRMGTPKAKKESGFPARNIVFYDKDIVVVNKPAGLMSVPHRLSEETATLDRLVMGYLRIHDPKAKGANASLGVVHRIDKETSGLLVFARNLKALKGLSSQFRSHSIDRIYYAIAHGDVKSQTVRTKIARDNGKGIRGSVPDGMMNPHGEELGRRAVTRFESIESLRGATLVACRLETGRTHQIRIHLSEIGHPIIGEKVYVRDFKGDTIPADRVMLHAAKLGLMHPHSGDKLEWREALPKDFQKRLTELGGAFRMTS